MPNIFPNSTNVAGATPISKESTRTILISVHSVIRIINAFSKI